MTDENESKKPDNATGPGGSRHPKTGWKAALKGTWQSISQDHLSIIAAGVAFYVMLASIPALAAGISIYGLVSNPEQIREHFSAMEGMMPQEANQLLAAQMDRIASEQSGAGIAAIIGIVLALWAGSRGTKAMMEALNITYNRKEERGFIKLAAVSVGLTLFLVILGLLAIALLVVIPPLLSTLNLPSQIQTILEITVWPLLLLIGVIGITVLYRFGPSRENLEWKWFTVGSITAAILWVLASALFGIYAANFGSYNETYGSLGAIIVTLLWFYISAFVLLLGAELNAALEAR